jgi:signal transduction histidine kinase
VYEFEEKAHQLASIDKGSELRDALLGFSSGRGADEAARHTLESCVRTASAGAGALYLRDLRTGELELYVASEGYAARSTCVVPEASEELQRDGSRLIVPASRLDTTIGTVVLDELANTDLKGEESVLADLRALAQGLVMIYEHRFASGLLQSLQAPIPYDRSTQAFLNDLLELIRASSGMRFAAIRELEGDGSLTCLGVAGFGDNTALEDWTFDELKTRYPAFAEALEGHSVQENDMAHPRNRYVAANERLSEVESYAVLPIEVGTEIFGTLSLATSCRYVFSPLELAGFEALANGVGVSLTNFNNFHDMRAMFGDLALASNAKEVAASVRHETRDIMEDIRIDLSGIARAVGRAADQASVEFDELDSHLDLLKAAYEKFKVAAETPTREPAVVNIREAWAGTVNLLRGRLGRLRVATPAPAVKPSLSMLAYPDGLRQIFLNLVLNSLDAFESTSTRKGGRQVRLRVDIGNPRDNVFHMYVSDNATGIEEHRLLGPGHLDHTPWSERIFHEHVTSKRHSETGYLPDPEAGMGLWLVRKLMNDHDGSVDLVDTRNGATFRLTFPRDNLQP